MDATQLWDNNGGGGWKCSYYDAGRGVKHFTRVNAAGQVECTVVQRVPDSFDDDVAFLRDSVASGPKTGTQNHMRPTLIIPDTVMHELLKDGNGQAYDLRDPDRDKAIKRIANDIDYRNFRVDGGRV